LSPISPFPDERKAIMIPYRFLAPGLLTAFLAASTLVMGQDVTPGPFAGRIVRLDADRATLTLAIDQLADTSGKDRRLSTDTTERTIPPDRKPAEKVMRFRVSVDAVINLNGRPARLRDLRAGQYARVYPGRATGVGTVAGTREPLQVITPSDTVLIRPIDTRRWRIGRDRPSDSVPTRPTDPPRPRVENPRPTTVFTDRAVVVRDVAGRAAMVAVWIEAFSRSPAATERPTVPDRSLRTTPKRSSQADDTDR
jgi:hypothetical protein